MIPNDQLTVPMIANAVAGTLGHQCTLPETRDRAATDAAHYNWPVFPAANDCHTLRALQGAWRFVGEYRNHVLGDLPAGVTGWRESKVVSDNLSWRTATGRLIIDADGETTNWPGVTVSFYAGPDTCLILTIKIMPRAGFGVDVAVLGPVAENLIIGREDRLGFLCKLDSSLDFHLIPALRGKNEAIDRALDILDPPHPDPEVRAQREAWAAERAAGVVSSGPQGHQW